LCREEGQQLSQLSAAHRSIFEDFGIFGMVKEINVDDAGLLEFHKKYFPHDIYLDASQQFYKTLGSRKITTLRTWNPLRLWRGYQDMKERITRKNLEGNLIGEGIIQGGIVIFDRHGDPRAVYQEQIGNEIPEESILQALKALQEEYKQTSDGASAEL